MPNSSQVLIGFVLDRLEGEPVERRIELTLALAELAPSAKEQRALIAMAKDLAAIQRRHRQLLLDFKLRQIS